MKEFPIISYQQTSSLYSCQLHWKATISANQSLLKDFFHKDWIIVNPWWLKWASNEFMWILLFHFLDFLQILCKSQLKYVAYNWELISCSHLSLLQVLPQISTSTNIDFKVYSRFTHTRIKYISYTLLSRVEKDCVLHTIMQETLISSTCKERWSLQAFFIRWIVANWNEIFVFSHNFGSECKINSSSIRNNQACIKLNATTVNSTLECFHFKKWTGQRFF